MTAALARCQLNDAADLLAQAAALCADASRNAAGAGDPTLADKAAEAASHCAAAAGLTGNLKARNRANENARRVKTHASHLPVN